jgi:hypothetical protein
MKQIYILRIQCKPCKLDKMEQMYSFGPGVTPGAYFKQLKPHIKRKFREVYGCTHTKDLKFTREIDAEYMWDEELNLPVPRSSSNKFA